VKEGSIKYDFEGSAESNAIVLLHAKGMKEQTID
jgi:hypothetical protein